MFYSTGVHDMTRDTTNPTAHATAQPVTPYAGYCGQSSLLDQPETRPTRYALNLFASSTTYAYDTVYETNTEYDAINRALRTIEYRIDRNPCGETMETIAVPNVSVLDRATGRILSVTHPAHPYGRVTGTIDVSSTLYAAMDYVANQRDNAIATAIHDYWSYPETRVRGESHTRTPLVGNFIDYDVDKSQITYLPTTRAILPARHADPYTQSGRQSAKPVRAFSVLYPEIMSRFNDAERERFNDLLVARLNPTQQFQIVRGDDVQFWYDESQYADDLGWSSCMSYSSCHDYLQIYASNPDKVGLVITTEDDMLTGRALIWTQDDGTMYLDRIYSNDARHAEQFRTFAQSQYPDTLTSYANSVTLKSYDHDEYPYMDTFRYLDMDNGVLLPSSPYSGHYRTLQDTSGGFDEYGTERTYMVTMTRQVTQTVTVYVTATDEDDAMSNADYEYCRMTIDNYPETYTTNGEYVFTSDRERWTADSAEYDSDMD